MDLSLTHKNRAQHPHSKPHKINLSGSKENYQCFFKKEKQKVDQENCQQ